MPHRVHTAMEAGEEAGSQAPPNAVFGQPEVEELGNRHHAVLTPASSLTARSIECGPRKRVISATFWNHTPRVAAPV